MDHRPERCRFRLQDEGKAYPRSSCSACGKTITTGLGTSCAYPADSPEDLPERVVRWFGFDDRKRIVWGPDYNQTARDLYEAACKATGRTPLPTDQPK